MAKGGGAPEQQSSSDGSLDFLWMTALLVVGTILLWYFGKVYIAMGIFKVKYFETKGVLFFVLFWNAVVSYLPFLSIDVAPLNQALAFIQKNYGTELPFADIVKISGEVGKYLIYPVALVLLALSATLFFGGSSQKFRNIFNMDSLKFTEQDNWPQITPVVKLDLCKQDLNEGPWAMALNPLMFCKKHGILEVEKKDSRYLTSVRRGAAYRVLSLQLGPRWIAPERLPMYLQALFAIFVARIDGDKKTADALIDQIAASAKTIGFKPGNLNYAGVIELLNKHKNAKSVMRIIALHGYVTTVMASLLSASREAGVLATSEFLWLKPVDRRMWYMLNSVGRPTVVSEISGAFAHWLAERKLGLPLVAPMIDEALRGLELAMSEIIYKPEED